MTHHAIPTLTAAMKLRSTQPVTPKQ